MTTVSAVCVGILFGLALLCVFRRYPGQAFEYAPEEEGEEDHAQVRQILESARKAGEKHGLPAEVFNAEASQQENESLLVFMTPFFFLAAFLIIPVALRDWKEDASFYVDQLARNFPREARVIMGARV